MAALAAGIIPTRRSRWVHRADGALFPAEEGIAVLSVRSGFDLLLGALALPTGSEVIVSALTIADMARIIREHGLVPVPVDLEIPTLSVKRSALEAAATPRTRAVLIAHVFGSRMSMDEISDFTKERGLLLIEDCAQAFDGLRYPGAPGADVAMFSFGPIKTQTCLGGGLLRVRHPTLRKSMKKTLDRWPLQSRGEYTLRVLKYTGICVALTPFGYKVLVKTMKGGHQNRLKALVRGFPGPHFFTKIRRRPCAPLLKTMARRLKASAEKTIDARKACCEDFARGLEIPRPGERARYHTHWVFPISVPNREAVIRLLREAGFDATRGTTSLTVMQAPEGHPAGSPLRVTAMMERLVFLPIYPSVPPAARNHLRRLLHT